MNAEQRDQLRDRGDQPGRGAYLLTVTAGGPAAAKGASRDSFEARVLYMLNQGVWPLPSDEPLTLDLAPGDRVAFLTWEPSAAHIVGTAEVASRPDPLTAEQAEEVAVYAAAQGDQGAATRLRLGARLEHLNVWRRAVPAGSLRERLPQQLLYALESETPPPDVIRLTAPQYAALSAAAKPEPEPVAAAPEAQARRPATAQERPALESVVAVPPGGLADGPALLNFVVEHWRAVDLSDELDIVEHLPAGAQEGAFQGVVCRSRRTGQLTVLVGAESGADAGVVGHVLGEIGRLNATPRIGGVEASGLIICSLPSEELRRAARAAQRIELTALRLRLRPAPARQADGGDERLRSAVEALGSWCGDAALGAARREGVPVATYLGKDSPLWRRARAVASAVDDRFPGAAGHSLRVSRVVRALAEDLGMGGEAVDYIELAGLLYDVGMMVVPDVLAEKRGPLTPEEFGLVQRHVDAGARLLQQFGVLSPVSLGVRHHHERWDGRGYPGHMTGDDIPLLARMISMADGFDAMTSVRPYRPAIPQNAALEAVTAGAGKQWDPGLVSALRRAVDRVASSGTQAVGRG